MEADHSAAKIVVEERCAFRRSLTSNACRE
jgi:hypothetical protein